MIYRICHADRQFFKKEYLNLTSGDTNIIKPNKVNQTQVNLPRKCATMIRAAVNRKNDKLNHISDKLAYLSLSLAWQTWFSLWPPETCRGQTGPHPASRHRELLQTTDIKQNKCCYA